MMALSTGATTGSDVGGDFTVSVGDSVSGNGGLVIVMAGNAVNALGGGMGGKLTTKAGDSNADSGESSSLSAGASTLGGGGVLTLTGGAGATTGGYDNERRNR